MTHPNEEHKSSGPARHPRDVPDNVHDGDYLWNPNAPVDAEIAKLEKALRPLREPLGEEVTTLGDGDAAAYGNRGWVIGLAATVLLSMGLLAFMLTSAKAVKRDVATTTGGRTSWRLVRDAGPTKEDVLPIGEWLVTGDEERVHLDVADIGQLTVDPKSRLRIVESHDDAHRMELSIGRLEAQVDAPPRLFMVDTPSARAVDMGCAYSLEVDDDGNSELQVQTGSVLLEHDAFRVHVPAGASCESTRARGPGIPWFDDASPEWKTSVEGLVDSKGAIPGVDGLVRGARTEDALSLFHVIPRVDGQARHVVLQALERLVELPEAITRQAAYDLEPRALDAWWDCIVETW